MSGLQRTITEPVYRADEAARRRHYPSRGTYLEYASTEREMHRL